MTQQVVLGQLGGVYTPRHASKLVAPEIDLVHKS